MVLEVTRHLRETRARLAQNADASDDPALAQLEADLAELMRILGARTSGAGSHR